MLAPIALVLADLVEKFLDGLVELLALLMEQTQMRKQQQHVLAGCLLGAGDQGEAGGLAYGQDLRRGDAADAILPEYFLNARGREPGGFGGCGSGFQ